MTVAKKSKPKKSSKKQASQPKDWREAVRLHLAKVVEVEAVFARIQDNVLHIYTVVAEFSEGYQQLMKRERQVEKAFPKMRFDFHTRAHQGRIPHEAVPWDSEQVFLR